MTHEFTNAQKLINISIEIMKIGEAQILEIITRNPKIIKRGEKAYQKTGV